MSQGASASNAGRDAEQIVEQFFRNAAVRVMSYGAWLRESKPKHVLVKNIPYEKPMQYEDGTHLRGYVEYLYVAKSGKMTFIEVKSQGGGGSKIEGLSYTLRDQVPELLKRGDVVVVFHYHLANPTDSGWDRVRTAYIKWAKKFTYQSPNAFQALTLEEAMNVIPSIIK